MNDSLIQLERLLAVSDRWVIRNVGRAVLGCPPGGRTLTEMRHNFLESVEKNRLVESALLTIAVDGRREYVPRSEWRLPELTGVGENVLHHQHFILGQKIVRDNF